MALPSKKNPMGPSFSDLEERKWILSGTELNIKTLKHNYDRVPERGNGGATLNLYDPSKFGRFKKEDKYEPLTKNLLNAQWCFYGFPFIHGLLGEIEFSVDVIYMPEFSNLFRPSNLQCAIERFLYASQDYALVPRSGEMRLNWDVTPINNNQWVHYGYSGATWLHSAEEVAGRIWQTPIGAEHLLTIVFQGNVRKPGTQLIREFAKAESLIMQSVELELSEQALKDKKEAQDNAESLVSLKGLPPYTFEEFYPMDDPDIAKMIGKKYHHEKPYEDIEPEIEQEIKDQKRKEKEITEKILKSHMRFKKE